MVPIGIALGKEEFTWLDVVDHLLPHELSCVKGVDNSLKMRVLSDGRRWTKEDASRFACLEANTARYTLFASMMHDIHKDVGLHISDNEVICIRDSFFEIDAAQFVASRTHEFTDNSQIAPVF